MEVRLKETGEVMNEQDFRRYLLDRNGPTYDTLTPDVAESLGVDVVFEGAMPSVGRYQFYYRDGVEQIGDKWHKKYTVRDLDDASKAQKDAEQAKSVREQRNHMLKDSDWTQVEDSPVDKAAWAKYRQELRDLPMQNGFPWDINWPVKPE